MLNYTCLSVICSNINRYRNVFFRLSCFWIIFFNGNLYIENCLSYDSLSNSNIIAVHGIRKQEYDFENIKTNCIQSGGIRFVAYDVTKVFCGDYSNKTVVVAYYSNSEVASGLTSNALLILERPFFPYAPSKSMGEYWAIGGDAYRGIIAFESIKTTNVANFVFDQQLSNPMSKWISKEHAIEIASAVSTSTKNKASSNPIVEVIKRYAFGWLIQFGDSTQFVNGHWIVVVGDDGVVKDSIGGL